MAYTTADVAAVDAAILALAKGERVERVTAGDGRTVVYAQGATLKDLRDLRSEMLSEIGSSSARRRFVLTSTSKGL